MGNQSKPQIVCLCASTRFMDMFEEANRQLTLAGYIVLTVGVGKTSSGKELPPEVSARLDELHKRKIDLADWVFVLNVNGYIGPSTKSEIEYARKHKKRIAYLNPVSHPFDSVCPPEPPIDSSIGIMQRIGEMQATERVEDGSPS